METHHASFIDINFVFENCPDKTYSFGKILG